MPVPASISDLFTTPALNSPPGSESPSLLDDYARTHAAFIKQVSNRTDYSTLPSATSVADADLIPIQQSGVEKKATRTALLTNPNVTGNLVATGNSSSAAVIPTGASVPTNGMYLPSANTLAWSTNSTAREWLDSAGNRGLGVVPSAWGASFKAIDVGAYASFWNTSGGTIGVSYNAFQNGSNFIYKASGIAPASYQQSLGQHQWFSAPSGTAGNAITFTQVMSVDVSGNWSVPGTATAASFSGAGTNLTGTANSLNAGIGVNQTWQNMNASRALATSYTNSTGKPIMVSITNQGPTQTTLSLTVGGIVISIGGVDSSGSNNGNSVCGIVPNGATYSCAGGAFTTWAELR